MSGKQHLRNLFSMPFLRAAVLGILQKIPGKGFRLTGFLIIQNTWYHSGDRIHHDHSRKFSTGKYIITNGNIVWFITFMRNGVLLIAATVILPQFWGLTGIWLSMPVGEFLGFLLTLWVFWRNRDNYGYGRNGLALRIDGRD